MSATTNGTFQLTGNVIAVGPAVGGTQSLTMQLGAGDWAQSVTGFSTGTGDTVTGTNGQANLTYSLQRTLAGGATDALNLTDGSLAQIGQSGIFTKVKMVIVQLLSPDGIIKLQFGPLGNANAWQGPFGGTGATVFKEIVDTEMVVNNKWAGYGISGAGAGNIMSIKNPGGGSVTYNILIVGR